MLTFDLVNRVVGSVDCCPWGATTGRHEAHALHPSSPVRGRPLYTPAERKRRDESRWTLVQGILAPIQFAVFAISLCLVARYLMTGNGLSIATGSVVLKTTLLYTIMVTGAIWERDVFGQYLFAPAFFWEDVVSMLVIGLHTAYLIALVCGSIDAERQMWLALAAYSTYVINATQFILKLRSARMQSDSWPADGLMGQT